MPEVKSERKGFLRRCIIAQIQRGFSSGKGDTYADL
jgi:hypothetical protein